MQAATCGIYIAFHWALAPCATAVGSSKEERAIKADVSAQEGQEEPSSLGDTFNTLTALCPHPCGPPVSQHCQLLGIRQQTKEQKLL